MMLSLSTELSGTQGDLALLAGKEEAARQCNIPFAMELIRFAEAIVSRDDRQLLVARDGLQSMAGEAVVVTAASVAANFQRMVRIADATGIPIDADRLPVMNPAIEALKLRRFASSTATPPMEWWRQFLSPILRWRGRSRLRELDRRARSEESSAG